MTGFQECLAMDQDNRVKVPVSYPFPRHTSYQLELMFRQSLTGIFFHDAG